MAHSDMLAPASQLAGANLKDLQDLYDNVFLNSPDWEAARKWFFAPSFKMAHPCQTSGINGASS